MGWPRAGSLRLSPRGTVKLPISGRPGPPGGFGDTGTAKARTLTGIRAFVGLRWLREPALQDLQLVPHGARQLVAELLEPLGDLRDLLAPLLGLDGEGLLDLLRGHVQTGDVQGVRRRDVTDRRLDGSRGALEALDDPLEHAAVLAEARPQEAAVLVAPEPVHVEDPRQLRGVVRLAGLDPVADVVTAVVAD